MGKVANRESRLLGAPSNLTLTFILQTNTLQDQGDKVHTSYVPCSCVYFPLAVSEIYILTSMPTHIYIIKQFPLQCYSMGFHPPKLFSTY